MNHKCAAPPSLLEEPATQAVQRTRQNRDRRLSRYQEFRTLVDAGMNHSQASRQLGIPLRTVQRWAACGVSRSGSIASTRASSMSTAPIWRNGTGKVAGRS